ncbi:MAG: ABC transporter permease [Armatimonadota bacterium]|nr:ABC transporter permease [Armatimonadota bacterium]MDR7528329.1 ABC transporter permease [Armatimonadota bacterium]MDR7543722.1 ABC transporter permease [Armatimonadota bacterium]MDR7573768.1 ABC transporter permease [Armatimonadota bacterium]MDR7584690.1 ABC transporter permease [Armatimonadota bacterium]
MGGYIARRVLGSVPVLVLVVTAVFFLFQLIPGDPARALLGPEATPDVVEQVRRDLGLDRPILTQYMTYLGRLGRGDLGKSISTRRPVAEELAEPFWNTLKLAVVSIVLATLVGVLLGIVAAVRQGTVWDHLASVVALLGISIPVFWLALLMMYLFSVRLQLLPSAGDETWRHYLMPTLSLATFSLAFIARMTRSSLLEVIRMDYVRTARAKGVPEWRVILHHALRNALLPVVIVVGLRFGYMLGGAVVTEQVFAWPGLGRLLVMAVSQRDIPLIQGILLLFATTFVVVNLVVDVLYGFLEPQIRYR